MELAGHMDMSPMLLSSFPSMLSTIFPNGLWRSRVNSISVSKQAFIDATSAQNPALTYGASGILGLGFTSLSTIG